ncbi:MAG: hypothetical protein QM682_06350 [Paracoccus sp. (in: a-proteobacteria)]|uniref:hypothetical protein n=1 Tax=Paracoccus sp. TaxID=267 RepID=UPI0039E29B21
MTQTIESNGQRLLPTRQFFLDRLWIWLTGIALWLVGTIFMATFLAIFTPFWDTAKAVWHAPLVLSTCKSRWPRCAAIWRRPRVTTA